MNHSAHIVSFAAALLISACATEQPDSSLGHSRTAINHTQNNPSTEQSSADMENQFSQGDTQSGSSKLRGGAPPIFANSYILIDPASGAVLAAQNADAARSVASTQKILTALIVVEKGNLDEPVRITESDVAVEPSKLGVQPGEVYTRRELVTAILIKSVNDVANALARDNAGSVAAFATKMNARARSLGAKNTFFVNPHGLTAKGQHSTARDMARIATGVYNNDFIRNVVRLRHYTFHYADGRTDTLENTNELLGRMPECDGMKTGYTETAGRCLISTAHRNNREVLLVQLGTKSKYIWNDGEAMMRWGLSK